MNVLVPCMKLMDHSWGQIEESGGEMSRLPPMWSRPWHRTSLEERSGERKKAIPLWLLNLVTVSLENEVQAVP